MFTRFLKTVFVFSFLFSLSLNAYQMDFFSLINNKGRGGSNEDRVLALDKDFLVNANNQSDLFATVFDGHGGPEISHFMSQNIFTLFNKYMPSEIKQSDIRQVIDEALKKTFEQLDNATRECMEGSTAIVCCKKGNTLHLANVGDSIAVLFRKVQDMSGTREHKVEDYKSEDNSKYKFNKEAKRVIENGGKIALAHYLTLKNGEDRTYYQMFVFNNHDPKNYTIIWCDEKWESIAENSSDMQIIKRINSLDRETFSKEIFTEWYVYQKKEVFVDGKRRIFVGGLGMSRSFGDCVFKSTGVNAVPDLYSWDLKNGDKYLVIASDGLWNGLKMSKIERIIDGGIGLRKSSKQICIDLCNESRASGCPDDISVILVLFDESDFVELPKD